MGLLDSVCGVHGVQEMRIREPKATTVLRASLPPHNCYAPSLYIDDDIVRVVDAHIDLERLLNMALARLPCTRITVRNGRVNNAQSLSEVIDTARVDYHDTVNSLCSHIMTILIVQAINR